MEKGGQNRKKIGATPGDTEDMVYERKGGTVQGKASFNSRFDSVIKSNIHKWLIRLFF
jgi:hypothetical protein